MSTRDTLEVVRSRFTAKVKNGVIVLDGVELAEGAAVTVIVDNNELRPPIPHVQLDDRGVPIMTPELEADLEAAIQEADRGDLVSLSELREMLRRP